LSFARFNQPQTSNTMDGRYPEKAGLKGLPPGLASLEFPSINFGGTNAPTAWTKSHATFEVENTYTVQDNVQWTKGKHSFTFGTQVQWLQINARTNRYGSSAEWSFSNSQTAGFNTAGTLVTTSGNSYASFLLGALSSSSVTEDSVVGTGARFRGYAWWVQDNYKLSQ